MKVYQVKSCDKCPNIEMGFRGEYYCDKGGGGIGGYLGDYVPEKIPNNCPLKEN